MEGRPLSLYVRQIPSLHGGISQQSPLVRSSEQLEQQTNAWSSLADGLRRRAPTEQVARLFATAPANAHIHVINRDTTERYVVVTANGGFKIFDIATGAEQPFEAPGGLSYLDGVTDYGADLSAFTVADYTFYTNRKKVCAMGAVGDDLVPQTDYFIRLNGAIGLDENGVPFAPGAAYQYKPNLPTGALAGTVQRFDKLPETATEGTVYKIQGDETSDYASYYVVRRGGVWDESVVKPGLVNAIDATTMPHALVRGADGVFRFAPFSWAPRSCGDTETSPNPGFIGRPIWKVLRYQNRLAFLSDENVVMSNAGDFGCFWRESQRDVLDSDVIEVSPTSTKVSLFKDASESVDGILLTSDQTQFSLSNGELGLSPSSLAIRPTTSYAVNIRAGLAALGSEVYFASENNGWANIYEYTRLSGADSTTAGDITGHVPRFIPAGVHAIIPSDEQKALFVLSSGAKSKVFVYQFFWTSNDEKAQSAWHEWDLGDGVEIVTGAYLGGYLQLCVKRENGLFLERIDLQSGARPASSAAQVFLDRRGQATGTYVSATNRTEIVLGYVPDQSRFRLVRSDAFGGNRHTLVDPTTYQWVAPTVVSIPGSEIAGPMIYGEAFETSFTFSTQFMRNPKGEAVTTGKLILTTFKVSYSDTAFFKTVVSPYGVASTTGAILPAFLSKFTGRVLGSASFKTITPAFHTGSYAFMVGGQNTLATIKIANDTHVASTFTAAEWEGKYHNRARF